MLFCTSKFALFFLIVFFAYWAMPWRRARIGVLLLASAFFYTVWNPWLAGLVLASSTTDYLLARGIEATESPRRKRLLLGASVTFNLGLLGYLKYANFFLRSLEAGAASLGITAALPVLKVIVPIGISFYTFEAISYVADVYRGRVRTERNLAHFLLFILFFPHLVAGPIVRARDFLPQVGRRKRWNWARAELGLRLILLGVVKKMAVADRLALYSDPVFAHPAAFGTLALWLGAIACAVQIYCDFSGYSDLALGSGPPARLPLGAEFRPAVLGRQRRRVLATLAHLAVELAAGLCLHSTRRQPGQSMDHVSKCDPGDDAGWPVARGRMELRPVRCRPGTPARRPPSVPRMVPGPTRITDELAHSRRDGGSHRGHICQLRFDLGHFPHDQRFRGRCDAGADAPAGRWRRADAGPVGTDRDALGRGACSCRPEPNRPMPTTAAPAGPRNGVWGRGRIRSRAGPAGQPVVRLFSVLIGRPPCPRDSAAADGTDRQSLGTCSAPWPSRSSLARRLTGRAPRLRDPVFEQKAACLAERRAEAPDRPLLIALGSSRTLMGLNAGQVTAADGRWLTFNFGDLGAGPMLEQVFLRRLLARGVRPDALLIEIVPLHLATNVVVPMEESGLDTGRLSAGELRMVAGYYRVPCSSGVRWLQARGLPCVSRQRALHDALHVDETAAGMDSSAADGFGFLAMPQRPPEARKAAFQASLKEYGRWLPTSQLAPGPVRAVRDLIALCRREHLPFTVVIMPECDRFRQLHPPEFRADFDQFLADTRRAGEFPLLDARGWVTEDGFCDLHHLNVAGAKTFHARLGRELIANMNPPSRAIAVAAIHGRTDHQ